MLLLNLYRNHRKERYVMNMKLERKNDPVFNEFRAQLHMSVIDYLVDGNTSAELAALYMSKLTMRELNKLILDCCQAKKEQGATS